MPKVYQIHGKKSTPAAGYYSALKGKANILDVARKLLAEHITFDDGNIIKVDCPNHDSKSRTSFIVDGRTQTWYCFACGVGGDVFQLVEFINTGTITKHRAGQTLSESHRAARNQLAAMVGMAPLHSTNIDPEEFQKQQILQAESVEVQFLLTHLLVFFQEQLFKHPEVIEWIGAQYGFDIQTIVRFLLGYSPADFHDEFVAYLKANNLPIDERWELTGLVRLNRQGRWIPFFKNRMVIFHFKNCIPVYAVGRLTPFTPSVPVGENECELHSKYKKLPLFNTASKYEWGKFTSATITNDSIFGEDEIRKSKVVHIAEGYPDCIAHNAHGFPTISPGTTRFNEKMMPRLMELCRGKKEFYVWPDVEESGIGQKTCLSYAVELQKAGMNVRIVELPKGDGIDKVDVCEWWRLGGTVEEAERLMACGLTPISYKTKLLSRK